MREYTLRVSPRVCVCVCVERLPPNKIVARDSTNLLHPVRGKVGERYFKSRIDEGKTYFILNLFCYLILNTFFEKYDEY